MHRVKRAAVKPKGFMEAVACHHLYAPLHHYSRLVVFSTKVVNVCGQLPGSSDVEAAGIKPQGPEAYSALPLQGWNVFRD